MKDLLAAEEQQNSGLFKSILSAIRPLMRIDRAEQTAFQQSFTTEREETE
jgi:hypothetical protein